MVCAKCGTPVPEQDKNCPKCMGDKIISQRFYNHKIRKKRNATVFKIVATIVAAVVLAFIGSFVVKAIEGTDDIYYIKNASLGFLHNKSAVQLLTGALVKGPTEGVKYTAMVKQSKDGKTTVFVDGADQTTNTAALYIKTSKDKKVKVSDAAHSTSFTISDNGKNVLFMENYNESKSSGDLYLFSGGKKDKISSSAKSDMFGFALDGNTIFYVENFDQTAKTGVLDLRMPNKTTVKVDSGVSTILGFSKDSQSLYYGRDNGIEKNYDVYKKDVGKDSRRIATSVTTNFFDGNKDFFYTFKNEIYLYTPTNGATKIDAGFKAVLAYNNTERSIMYTKDAQVTKNFLDVYYYNNSTKNAVSARIVQNAYKNPDNIYTDISVASDCSYITFMDTYSIDTNTGAVNSIAIVGGKIGAKKKYSDGVLGFKTSANAKNVAYLKRVDNDSFELICFAGDKNYPLLKKTSILNIDMSDDGKHIVYGDAAELGVGNMIVRNLEKNTTVTVPDVYYFITKDFNKILYVKNFNTVRNDGDLYVIRGTEAALKVDENVTDVLYY